MQIVVGCAVPKTRRAVENSSSRSATASTIQDPESSLAELRQAEADLSDVCRRTRRIFGASHPESAACEWLMGQLKATIVARDSGDA